MRHGPGAVDEQVARDVAGTVGRDRPVHAVERGRAAVADGWTAVTRDKSLSAQFEQTLVVTDDGCQSLTPFEL